MEVLVSDNLQKYLVRSQRTVSSQQHGILYGLKNSNSLVLLMCALCDEDVLRERNTLEDFLDTNNQVMPGGLFPAGLFIQGNIHKRELLQNCRIFFREKDPHVHPEDFVLLCQASNSKDMKKSSYLEGFVLQSDVLQPIPVIIKSNVTLLEHYAVFYHSACLDSALTPIHNKHGLLKALELKLIELQIEDKSNFVYGLENQAVLLVPGYLNPVVAKDPLRKILNASTTIEHYLNSVNKFRKQGDSAPRSVHLENLTETTEGSLPMEPILLRLFRNATNSHKSHGSSPMLAIGEGLTSLVRFQIKCFIFMSKDKTLTDLMEIAELARKKHLAATADFLRRSPETEDSTICCPTTYHVVCGPNVLTLLSRMPSLTGGYLSRLEARFGFPDKSMRFSTAGSLESRRMLTKKNLLSVGEKLLAKNSAFLNQDPLNWEVTHISGLYSYHHYKQDRFDDEGWGCAYRSLQTIFSYYKLQGHTNLPIPSHDQIQRILVEIKDRNKSLIGSKQWIGAMEISRVLDHLLQVQCRIVNVSSGRELGTAFAALKDHFETDGSPVMIGGGVYAYTLVGVAINRASGEVKVMVVDPHYIGEDDIDLILKKNGVAWRTPEFWDQTAFYNLCCPLRL